MLDKQHRHSFNKVKNVYLSFHSYKTVLECECGKTKERKSTVKEQEDYQNQIYCKTCGIEIAEHENEGACLKTMNSRIDQLTSRINDLENNIFNLQSKFNF